MQRQAAVIMLSCATLGLGGCLVSGSSKTRIDGAYVAPVSVAGIEIGGSDRGDVLRSLSEPSEKRRLGDGTETWSWHWTRTDKGSGRVFLLFSGESEKRVDQSVHVSFDEHGIVTKKWRD